MLGTRAYFPFENSIASFWAEALEIVVWNKQLSASFALTKPMGIDHSVEIYFGQSCERPVTARLGFMLFD